jgi:hypothetical protein
MLSDQADWETYERVRREILSPPYPASAGFAATMLYPGMRVGLVNGVAVVNDATP